MTAVGAEKYAVSRSCWCS